MNYYFAPMEGITWYIYRNAHYSVFPGIKTYYTPFIVPSSKKGMRARELRDILPENNKNGIPVVPQILTNRWEDFLETAEKLKQAGYQEVNLNLGCPSGTVVAKGKGSGFLSDQKGLETFLDHVTAGLDMKLSIKTRIGKEDPEEFHRLLKIFNQYPLEMLIIHPRVQTDHYKNHPNLPVFAEAVEESRNPVCYNGDIFTKEDWKQFQERFPKVEHVMLGRGLVADPGLVRELEGGDPVSKEELRLFHDRVYREYKELLSGDRNVLFRMKELWAYMAGLFPEKEKTIKKIKKAETCLVYEQAVEELFSA